MVSYKRIDINDEIIIELETLRFNVYNLKSIKPNETYFFLQMKEGKIIPFGAYLEDKLIGACYVSKTYQTLFIDQLFVSKEYQNNEEHIGTNLLKYVLDNKKVCEEYFNTAFNFSYLDNRVSKTFFENLGYKENNNDMMSKRI